MSNNHQVVIIQKGRELPEGLRQSLQGKGFGTQVVTTDAEARNFITGDQMVVVVYCSDEVDLGGTIQSLDRFTELHAHPLIIVGTNVDHYESHLNQHFVLATTITTPCSTTDILAAVEYVVRYIEKHKPAPKTQSASTAAEDQAVHNLYRQFDTVPALVFDQLMKLGVLKREIGGGGYATNFRTDRSAEKPYMPADPAMRTAVLSIAESLPDSKAARYFRVASLSHLLCSAIGISGDTLEHAHAASLFYSSSFIATNRDLVIREYLSDKNSALRKEICSRVKDSAMSVSAEFSSPPVGKLIAAVGRFIGGEGVPQDSTEDLAASCIAAADLVDRIVFDRGVFQPVATYCFLAKLKTVPISQIHPVVLGCLIKLLAEAVTSQASGISKSKKLRNTVTFLDAADAIKDAVLNPQEHTVALASLTPGMKLSRPISTFDGKELLNDEMVLDQDLIWRLWQLAAIRPLGSPVVVFTDS